MRFGSQQSRGAHALFRAHEFRFARTDVRQAHFGGVEDSTHLQRGLGHHGLEAIAVHRFDERRQLNGDALRFVDIATIERVGEVTHRTGGRVRDHRDDADGADGQERQEQAVIARIPGQTGLHALAHRACDVAGGVLDGLDVVEFGHTTVGFQLDVQSGTAS